MFIYELIVYYEKLHKQIVITININDINLREINNRRP